VTPSELASFFRSAADAIEAKAPPAIHEADLRKAAAARRAERLLSAPDVFALCVQPMPFLPDGGDGPNLLGLLIADWRRLRATEAAPGDAPAAPGIDAGAIERAVDRIEALSQSPRCYDWQVRPEFRADDAEIRRFYDRFGGETGFDEAGRRARMEVFARVLREELGLAPAAGRGGDAKGGGA
jgi:hypothetical protein